MSTATSGAVGDNTATTEEPAPQALQRVLVWDWPTRAFHWLLVGAVLAAVITGQVGGDWMLWHGRAGLAIVGLLVFRLVWGFIGGTHARFVNFVPLPSRVWAHLRGRWQGHGHNPLGALSVLLLLGLLFTQALTGLFSNDEIAFTGPWAARVSDELSLWLTSWHHRTADTLLIFIGLHVVAIAFYALFKRNNLVKPMWTGYKEGGTTAASQHSRRAGWRALIVALFAAVAAVVVASGEVAAPADSAPAAPAAEPVPQQKPPAW